MKRRSQHARSIPAASSDLAVASLKHRDWRVRKNAARQLVGQIGSVHVLDVAKALDAEDHPDVVKWLAMAIARARRTELIPLLRRKLRQTDSENTRDWLVAAIAVLQPDDLSSIADWARSADPMDARDAAIGAWAAPALDERVRRELLRNLDRQGADVRRWATLALHEHGGAPIEPAVENLGDSQFLLREWSAHVLAERRSQIALGPLLERFEEDPSPRVREWASKGIAAYEREDLNLVLLRAYAREPDEFVREAIVGSMVPLASREPYRGFALDTLANEPSAIVTGEAVRVIASSELSEDDELMRSVEYAVERFRPGVNMARHFASALLDHPSTDEARVIRRLERSARLRLLWQVVKSPGVKEAPAPGRLFGLIVIALDEEIDVARESATELFGRLRLDQDSETGLLTHEVVVPTDLGPRVIGLALIGKGQDRAAARAAILVERRQPSVVVSVGIAGALSRDLQLCDVLVADEVVSYLSNAKVVEGPAAAAQLRDAPATFRSDAFLVDRARQLTTIAGLDIERMQTELNRQVEAEPSLRALRDHLSFATRVGPLACGPIVVASTSFKQWLLSRKRDYLAVDMESVAVAIAAEAAGMVRRVRFLAVRGISDLADEQKSELEEATSNRVRAIAMRAAMRFALVLLSHLPERLGSDE